MVDPLQIHAHVRGQVRPVGDDPHEAEYRRQGRPDLVAHIGQEFRLGEGRALRRLLGGPEVGFQFHMAAHIADDVDAAVELAVLAPLRHRAGLQPDPAAVPPPGPVADDPLGVGPARRDGQEGGRHEVPVIGMDEVGPELADQLLRQIAGGGLDGG